jgi:cobalt-zinc-cadmium efflux system membrane fusion protein
VIKSVRWVSLVGVALTALLVVGLLFGLVPTPWKSPRATAYPPEPRRDLGVELVPDRPHTLHIPEDVRRALGIRKGNEDVLGAAVVPARSRSLVLSGSTALDPTRLYRLRIRFAPAEVVTIGETEDAAESARTGQTALRELRPGDRVAKGQLLAVVHSADVGNKKNDLIDALVQLKLDQEILDRAEKASESGAVADVTLLNARRNVEADRNAVARAENTLRLWGIDDQDIQAVRTEAGEILKRGGRRDPEKIKLWPRVELRAPTDGTIVERNVAAHETIVDNTLNVFQIANVDRLLVFAHCPEDDLETLEVLEGKDRRWAVATVGARGADAVEGPIEEIGYLIDPMQHTAVIKGYIANPGRKLRAGQFVTASIPLPPPRTREGIVTVVQIPIDALVEDGRQSLVFVETDREKHHYTMRRVVVADRVGGTAFVRRLPIPRDEQRSRAEEEQGLQPREPLQEGERLLLSGVVELKTALLELESGRSRGTERQGARGE